VIDALRIIDDEVWDAVQLTPNEFVARCQEMRVAEAVAVSS
jgi:hypothetical protein